MIELGRVLIVSIVVSLLVSCADTRQDGILYAEVDSAFWGEEIVKNDTNQDLVFSIYEKESGWISQEIGKGKSVRYNLPSMKESRCVMRSDSISVVFSDGKSLKVGVPDPLFSNYHLEESDYLIDSHTIASRKWPEYTYVIDDSVYSRAGF